MSPKTLVSCCEHLRCKSMYYDPQERPGRIHDDASMTYWCQKTQTPVGPDSLEARPSACQPTRPCFSAQIL